MKKFLLGLGIAAITILSASSYNYHATWSYSGKTGPEYWGDLKKEYQMCKIGKNQSPIDIKTNSLQTFDTNLKPFKIKYLGKGYEVINNGHTIKVKTEGKNCIKVDGIKFKLAQFHFHTPSENTINGKHFPMEAHFVHLDKNGNITVLAVMFKIGKENKSLNKMLAVLPTKVGEENKVMGNLNPMELLPKNKAYYRFNGSLTTPPCSEGVRWIVFKTPVEISQAQYEKMHAVMGTNNRPVQPINARVILK